ncbi:MAG TPA: hypothetical protein VN451_00175 [Chitinophagaceae bacterium]|nr:hypothetical protein [Chitinophagaceae bacterium]
MKKTMLTLAIAISSFASFATGSFSARFVANEGEEKVNQKVLEAFKSEFGSAKNVEWVAGSDYYRAAFVYYEKHVFAYYSSEGNMLGLTRYISPVDLPISLQIGLKKFASGFWISDLFEVAKNETTTYYITLENADEKVVFKSSNSSCWEEFKSVKKV